MLRLLLLLLSLFLSGPILLTDAMAVQSGPSAASTFAAAAAYDPLDRSVYITGTTFDNDAPACFLAKVLGDDDYEEAVIGTPEDFGGCHSLRLQGHRLTLVGHTETGGWFQDDEEVVQQSSKSVLMGSVLDMEVGSDTFEWLGGGLLDQSPVVYPVGVWTDDDDDVFVVSMESNDTMREQSIYRSQVDPARFFSYGENYEMVVSKYTRQWNDGMNETKLTSDWRWEFATDEGVSVHVAGVVRLQEYLLIAGATSGYGDAFGLGFAELGGDFDGFVTKLYLKDGVLVEDWSKPQNRPSTRIASSDDHDDWIASLCHDPNDPRYIYLVGATEGYMAHEVENGRTEAFLVKLDAETLLPAWTKQLGAYPVSQRQDTQVHGVSCQVTPDGTAVYLAGAVSGRLKDQTSAGGTDVFCAKFDTDRGTELWVTQLGSSGDDHLAMRGGLVTDDEGNVILVGNTYGGMYREKETPDEIAEVFVVSLSGVDGSHEAPFVSAVVSVPGTASAVDDLPSGLELLGGQQPTENPQTPVNEGSAQNPGEDPVVDPVVDPTIEGTPIGVVETPVDRSSKDDDSSREPWIVMVLLVVTLGGVSFAYLTYRSYRRHRMVTTDRSEVLNYLSNFDIEDVDLAHSASGGWSCSYANDLAYGLNRYRKQPATGNRLLLDDPFLKHSLFMDDDEEEETNGREAYTGLVDAYNRTWEDRKPRGWGRNIV